LAASSATANPRAALAALRGIVVRRRFPPVGRPVRAAESLRRIARLLTVVAFTRCVSARRAGSLRAQRRPPTSCAHRLRKPGRTNELLTLHVARWALRCGLPPVRCEYPEGWLPASTAPFGDAATGRLPSRQIRRCRRRFRTTTTGRTEAPSIGSYPSLSTRAGSTSLVVHSRSLTPHPVARREPCLRKGTEAPFGGAACLVKGGRLAPSHLALVAGFLVRGRCRFRHRDPRFAARKMRLTDFCNRLHSRAPSDCPIPGAPPAAPAFRRSRRACRLIP